MKKLISTLGIFTLIFTTSCEKESMDSLPTNPSNEIDTVVIVGLSNQTNDVDNTAFDSSVFVSIEINGTQDIKGTTPQGITLYEALEGDFTGEHPEITGSTVYHIDDAGFLIMSYNGVDGSESHIRTKNFEIY